MAALFLTNGTRVTRAAFPSAAVSGRNVVHATTVDIFERKPAANDPRMDDSPLGGQVFKLFARAGTILTVGQIDDLYTKDAATFTSCTPSTGGTAGGTVVTIVGTNLDGVSAVNFDGTPGTVFSVVNRNTLLVTTPAKAAGARPIIIVDDGNATLSGGNFTYV